MPNTVDSQYMEMPLPVPTVQIGPDYAVNINSSLTIVDQHDHSTGKGVPINPSGLNINSDLAFGNNNLTGVRSTRYQTQASPISLGTDLGCTYVSGVDLYFNDRNGNQIRLTASGGVAGSPGSIGNLTSPASVTYISNTQTYIFQASTATPGNIDCGYIILRENVANGSGITFKPSASIASDYEVTWPASLPASTALPKIMTINNSGQIAYNYQIDNSSILATGNTLHVNNPNYLTANFPPSSGNGLQFLRGTFNGGNGAIISGQGFSVARINTGDYVLTYTTPFATSEPYPSLFFQLNDKGFTGISSNTESIVNFQTYGSGGGAADFGVVSFLAIGQKA